MESPVRMKRTGFCQCQPAKSLKEAALEGIGMVRCPQMADDASLGLDASHLQPECATVVTSSYR